MLFVVMKNKNKEYNCKSLRLFSKTNIDQKVLLELVAGDGFEPPTFRL